MLVNNLNGTSDNICKCGSWLMHYKNFTKRPLHSFCLKCAVCNNIAEVGGHVQKSYSTDKSWYIIPLCKSCNAKSSSEVVDIGDTELVPASRSDTCGY